jgi:hypothetical protein
VARDAGDSIIGNHGSSGPLWRLWPQRQAQADDQSHDGREQLAPGVQQHLRGGPDHARAPNLYANLYNPLTISFERTSPWAEQSYSLPMWQTLTSNDPTGKTLAGTYQVVPATARTVSSTELVTDGTFDTDIGQWKSYSTGIACAWVASCGLDGGCYEAQSNQAVAGAQLGLSLKLALVANKTYLLRLSMQASNYELVNVVVMRDVSPWDSFVRNEIVVSPTRTDYAFIVSIPESTDVRLAFGDGTTDGATYDIDNVSMREASQVITNDPVDDSRIVFNAAPEAGVIDLGATSYCDVTNQVISGSLSLGPFESRILLSCFCNNDGTCNNKETSQSCSGDCP